MKKIFNYIDGRIKSNSNNYGDIYDPSKGEIIGKVSLSNSKDLNEAIKSSKKAFTQWSNETSLKRSRVIAKFKNLIENNIDHLAEIVSIEHGKTIEDAKGSVIRGLEVVEFACGIPHLLKGEFSYNVGSNIDSFSLRQPLGICAGITPFNFPAMVPMWMFPISIACGNSFILKPSKKSFLALKLAQLFTEAGLPNGVFNVVNGDKEIVDLLSSKDISSISFVGSTPVAKYIYEKSAKNLKEFSLLEVQKTILLLCQMQILTQQ